MTLSGHRPNDTTFPKTKKAPAELEIPNSAGFCLLSGDPGNLAQVLFCGNLELNSDLPVLENLHPIPWIPIHEYDW